MDTRLQSWPRNWLRAITEVGAVSEARRAEVLRDIAASSEPTAVYYVLLGLSELIAGFALIIGSDATRIGAGVVAPLMTPIFGVSLGLVRGDLRLLRKAMFAGFGGAALGVALGCLLGLTPFLGDPSAALLAQTRPTGIDPLVAALAGFAAALAMIDRRISPALPGVAIATVLNPPVAAVGLCLASGAYRGAWGALLLFFADFVAIVAVAVVLFGVAGFATRSEIGSPGGLARRFAAAAVGLLLVTGLLTSYVFGLVRNLRTESAIHGVVDEALSREPNTALVNLEWSRGSGGLEVLGTVRTPRALLPDTVDRIQNALHVRLGQPVRLFMRCVVTQDVSATGSTNLRPGLDLNGKVTEAPLAPSMRLLQQAEQVAREVAASRPEFVLTDVELVDLPSRPVLVVSVQGAREPTPDDVERLETLLRERLGERDLRVVMRRTASVDVTSKGRILLGDAHFGAVDAAEEERRGVLENAVRAGIEALPNLFVAAIDAAPRDGAWTVRAEVVGPRVLTPAEVHDVEQRGSTAIGEPVRLSVWSRAEVQVTGERYEQLGGRR